MEKLILSKTDNPPFAFILITGSSYVDYYVYQEEELELAISQLRAEHAKGYQTAYIGVPHYCENDGTYRVKHHIKLLFNGKIEYEEYGRVVLHVAFYTESGKWLNSK